MKLAKQRAQTLLSGALSLMVLAACSPTASLNGNLSGPQAPQNQASTQNQAAAGSNQAAVANVSAASLLLQQDLTQVHDDEAAYQDSLSIAAEQGFAIKLLGADAGDELEAITTSETEVEAESNTEVEADVDSAAPKATAQVPPRPMAKAQLIKKQVIKRVVLKPQQARERYQVAKEKLKDNLQDFRRQSSKFAAHEAISFSKEGKITLDPRAFFKAYKDLMSDKKMKFEKHLDQAKKQLRDTHELNAGQKQKLKRKNFLIKHSDKVTVTNADGSTTDTYSAEFKHEKTDLYRKTYLAITKMGDQVLVSEFKLETSTPAYDRESTRVATHNSDGTVSILIDSKTSWKNGKTREMHQERLRQADGQVNGTGTIVVTQADGTVKTKTLTITIAKSGDIVSSASEENSPEEVVINESANGEATVIVENEDGTTEATSVDLEAEAEVIAETTPQEPAEEASEEAVEGTDGADA